MPPSFAEFTVCLQIIVVCGKRKNVQFKIMKLLINYQGIKVGEIIFADKNPGAINWFSSACIQDCYLGLDLCKFCDYILEENSLGLNNEVWARSKLMKKYIDKNLTLFLCKLQWLPFCFWVRFKAYRPLHGKDYLRGHLSPKVSAQLFQPDMVSMLWVSSMKQCHLSEPQKPIFSVVVSVLWNELKFKWVPAYWYFKGH